jgi:hypothetical protein
MKNRFKIAIIVAYSVVVNGCVRKVEGTDAWSWVCRDLAVRGIVLNPSLPVVNGELSIVRGGTWAYFILNAPVGSTQRIHESLSDDSLAVGEEFRILQDDGRSWWKPPSDAVFVSALRFSPNDVTLEIESHLIPPSSEILRVRVSYTAP